MEPNKNSSKPIRSRWLTPGIAGVGAASFFSDSGHEIATAILPSFLTSVLHASAGVLGLIEGISDGLTGVMKLIGGPLANDPSRRARLASGGYIGTALATGAIGLAMTPWQAGGLRAIAWLSRGIRSPARDSLLASLAPKHAYGRAFGLERAGDNLGAVAGPLLAAGLVAWIGIRPAIFFAFIPGIFAAVAITVAAKEASRTRAAAPAPSGSSSALFVTPGLSGRSFPLLRLNSGTSRQPCLSFGAPSCLRPDTVHTLRRPHWPS